MIMMIDSRYTRSTWPYRRPSTQFLMPSFLITDNLWVFFKACLSGIQQCVVIDNHLSEWLPVSCGVPQGSILVPLMFILYINGLPSAPSSAHLYLFAVDLDQICNPSSRCDLDFDVLKCRLIHSINRNTFHTNYTYLLDGEKSLLSPLLRCWCYLVK